MGPYGVPVLTQSGARRRVGLRDESDRKSTLPRVVRRQEQGG